MRTVEEAAQAAETILLTDRNKRPGLDWLRAMGIAAPDMPGRCLHLGGAGATVCRS